MALMLASPTVYGLSLVEKTRFGGFGTSEGKFKNPTGLAVIKNSILVVDSGNRRIQRFTTAGVLESTFKTVKDETGATTLMDTPTDICVDDRGAIFVTDSETSAIYQFDTYGQYVKTIGGFGAFGVKFNSPAGIARDLNGYLYVADRGNNRIMKLDTAGKKVFEISRMSAGIAQPIAVAITDNGLILVLDKNGVSQFDESGKFQKQVVPILEAAAIVVDDQNQIYVAQSEAQRISVYTIEGSEVLSFKPDLKPNDLFLDGSQLWVSDGLNHEVRSYEIR